MMSRLRSPARRCANVQASGPSSRQSTTRRVSSVRSPKCTRRVKSLRNNSDWPTLTDWIKIDRHFHSWLRQLKPRIEEWHKDPDDDGPLLRGNPLLAAEAWLANRGDELNEDERSFIKASIAQRDESLRNMERHRRLARRFIEVVATSIILLMGLGGFHLWVVNNNRNATWEMGWRGAQMHAWLLFHKPPEPMMAYIPGGSFKMGSPSNEGGAVEHPQHTVRLSGFAISKYDITFEQYDLFAAATLREMPSDRGWGRGNRPVVNVSWEDANDYIKWLNQKTGKHYRLPSEAEWEYAARAGTTTTYWWGNERDKRDGDRPHCNGCSSKFDGVKTAPVGSFDPNPWNLYDMAGNVWQWTADCWHESYVHAPNDGQIWTDESGGTCDSRVVRGGSWTGNPLDRRAAERLNVGKSGTESDLGFRLARDADGASHH
jgi:formylglycine-generating enzyme required for sulfatase activity